MGRLDDDEDAVVVAVNEPIEGHVSAGWPSQNLADGSGFVVLLHGPNNLTSVGMPCHTLYWTSEYAPEVLDIFSGCGLAPPSAL